MVLHQAEKKIFKLDEIKFIEGHPENLQDFN
jgi:hypothetical protein